jgi:hypothetical protein
LRFKVLKSHHTKHSRLATGGEETAMIRHMMRQDMRRSDMVQDHAAVSYYAGNRSYFGGFFWYAYFGGEDRYRLT